FLLVDRQQEALRRMLERRSVLLCEELLGAIEQTRTVAILGKLEFGGAALVGRKVRTVEQILVHPDGAVDLALSPEQAAEREMQVHGLRIDLDHFDERLDRLVGLV